MLNYLGNESYCLIRKSLYFNLLNCKCMHDSNLQLSLSIAALVAYIEVIRSSSPAAVVSHLESIVTNLREVYDHSC